MSNIMLKVEDIHVAYGQSEIAVATLRASWEAIMAGGSVA